MIFLTNIFSTQVKPTITESSYKELFNSWYTPLCRMIYRIIKNQDQTEDIVQDVYIKLWEKRDSLKINTSLKAYLYRAALNNAYTYLEKNKRYPKLSIETTDFIIPTHSNTIDDLKAAELETKINQTLLLLPPACREVFILSRQEEMSYKEIAETLEISVKTVENQMGKALKTFREELKMYI